MGYIHGDVRIENIVFAPDGTSYIIDFDLARKYEYNPSCYPPEYYYYDIRHSLAQASCPMKQEHNIFSMKKVMAEHFLAMKTPIGLCSTTEALLECLNQC